MSDFFVVGDFVTPKPSGIFRSGCSSYERAIVVSIRPFVLVSEEGDMLWSTTIFPSDCVPAGNSTLEERAKAFARWERELDPKTASIGGPRLVPPGEHPRLTFTEQGELHVLNKKSQLHGLSHDLSWEDYDRWQELLTKERNYLKASERIVAAAVLTDDGVIYAAPHHFQVHRLMARCAGISTAGEQGFMTSSGKFIGRIMGRKLAESKGQVRHPLSPPRTELYSEELWNVGEAEFYAPDECKERVERLRKAVDVLIVNPIPGQELFFDDMRAVLTAIGGVEHWKKEVARLLGVCTDYRKELEQIKTEVERLKQEVIWGFYMDDKPQFIQGYAQGAHEMTELCTAEEVNGYVNRIKELLSCEEALEQAKADFEQAKALAVELQAELNKYELRIDSTDERSAELKAELAERGVMGVLTVSDRDKRVVQAYLRCKLAEQGTKKRPIKMEDCWDAYALGLSIGSVLAPK